MKVRNGTSYHDDTPEKVIDALEYARVSQQRVRIFYGDAETGRDWLEEWDVTGYIGRSYGPRHIPLLIHSNRSHGGGALLDHCILKVVLTRSKRVLYQAKNYQPPNLAISAPPETIGKVNLREEGYTTGVYRDGQNVANFKSEWQAKRYIAFMLGQRMNK